MATLKKLKEFGVTLENPYFLCKNGYQLFICALFKEDYDKVYYIDGISFTDRKLFPIDNFHMRSNDLWINPMETHWEKDLQPKTEIIPLTETEYKEYISMYYDTIAKLKSSLYNLYEKQKKVV